MNRFGVIRKLTLLIYISFICILSFTLLENTSISISEFTTYKRPLLIIAAICIVGMINYIYPYLLKREYFFGLCLVLMFITMLWYSSITNTNTIYGYRPIYSTINMTLFIVELFLLAIVIAEYGYVERIFSLSFKYIIVLLIITDVLVFSDMATFTDGLFETYLIGTKFDISYLHIFAVAFYLLNRRPGFRFKAQHIFLTVFFSVLVIMLAIRVDCMTGVIGSVLLVVLMIIFNTATDSLLTFFSKDWVLILFIVGSGIIAFLLEQVVATPMVSDFIVNVLGRQITLTGRTNIYSLFILKTGGNLNWGYGLGSAYTTSMSLFGYADAQNAILQWILQIGIIPCVFMVLGFGGAFTGINRNEDLILIMPIIALIYVFICLGTIEITYNMNFFYLIALIFAWSHRKEMDFNTDENQ